MRVEIGWAKLGAILNKRIDAKMTLDTHTSSFAEEFIPENCDKVVKLRVHFKAILALNYINHRTTLQSPDIIYKRSPIPQPET